MENEMWNRLKAEANNRRWSTGKLVRHIVREYLKMKLKLEKIL